MHILHIITHHSDYLCGASPGHQHTTNDCLGGRRPKSNTDYWNKKLQRNVDRDLKNLTLLRNLGWDVLIVWECETADLERLQRRLIAFLGER